MIQKLRASWEKNWPEIHCALRRGLPQFLLSKSPRSPLQGIPVFCYHIPDAAGFEADLRYLRHNGYNTLTGDQLVSHLSGQQPAPPNSVVISFDDGSVEMYRTAFPLLQGYGFTAVAFIAPAFHENVPQGADHGRVCTWDELSEMHESGLVDVQSHTFEHRYLPRWPEPRELCGIVNGQAIALPDQSMSLSEDLARAKLTIENRLGKDVRHLCFPCYDGTAEAITAGKEVGYESFWWGVLPGVPDNRPGADAALKIVRVSGEFLRRLPGEGRVSLGSIVGARHLGNLRRWTGRTQLENENA